MVGMGLGLGLDLGTRPSLAIRPRGSPELLLQAELIFRGDKTNEGVLIRAAGLPWLAIVEELGRDPNFLFRFVQEPRKFEEFIAACYEKAGFDEVTLTPQKGDKGRDVIAVKRGHGSIRILEQTKAYKPGHRVTHDDVRGMLGALMIDDGASKGIITTTSEFQPGILKPSSEFARFMPHRLELKNGPATLDWVNSLAAKR
ncbi:restriction system protein [Sphingobium sp. B1D7B]|nr:restriction endonuclease [Sphingobium sp. B11D3A]MCW2406613.1 restriction system protein [Sphingobium sp. B1D7B]